MRITVFTPTYNRAYIIENLYRSLQRQTFKNFEWIIIDDGSVDNTETLFHSFTAENNFFPIRYTWIENGGKHRAINRGVKMAEGELFLIVDSDDYLTDDALEVIDRIEKTIPAEQKQKFCGVCGQRGYDKSNAIGSTFDGEILDATVLDRAKHGITGDRAEAFYTDVLRNYPFPEFPEERFLTECVIWDKIAYDGYCLRFFNSIIMVCNYLKDGLSARIGEIHIQNPKGYGLYIYQSIQFGKITGMHKWNSILDFYGSLRKKHSFRSIAGYLHMNPIKLWIRLFGMRVFYYLYK